MFRSRALASLEQEIATNREVTQSLFADMKRFMHEERLRANKVLEPMIENLHKLNASHDELIAEIRAQREDFRAQGEDLRAQREGFFALIDQLKRGHWPGEEPA